jgi:hypothetical protein
MGRKALWIVQVALVLAILATPAAAQVSVAINVGGPHVGVVVGAPVYPYYPAYVAPYPYPYYAPYPYYYFPYAVPYGPYYRAYPRYYGGTAYYNRGVAPYYYRGGGRPYYYRGGPANGRPGYYAPGRANRGNGGGARYSHARR